LRVLITGANGFVGQHLIPLFVESGIDIFAPILRGTSPDSFRRIRYPIRVWEWDLTSLEDVRNGILTTMPDVIIHLAAQSSVGASFKDPVGTYQVNFNGTLHLLDSVRQLSLKPIILLIASAEIYGEVEETHLPIQEEEPLHPLSPYGGSKAAADLLGYQYWKSFGLPIVRLRSFNHIGPQFVVSSWAKQIAEMEKGLRPARLTVGETSVSRDFLDVRDVVEAYRLAMTKARPGQAYNICSGKPIPLTTILEKFQSLAHINFAVDQSQDLIRKNDAKVIFGDPSKFQRETGWCSEKDLNLTLEAILNWWRGQV
jgi:GDP-4-dehydro-6-deoxy-D-mannose reductase